MIEPKFDPDTDCIFLHFVVAPEEFDTKEGKLGIFICQLENLDPEYNIYSDCNIPICPCKQIPGRRVCKQMR
jgi:hypothetical protein